MYLADYWTSLVAFDCSFVLCLFSLAGDSPMMNIPGYTFPVEEYLMEDVVEMIECVSPQPSFRDLQRKKFKKSEFLLGKWLGGSRSHSDFFGKSSQNFSNQY